jgi:glycosyltransferase involved in cell wall biosynthesis
MLLTESTDECPVSNKRILIISYLFPPMGGIGVQRALSLAKYLPSCGYDVHVLKATNAGGPVYDEELVRQIPPGVRVHQAFTPEIPFALRQKLWSKLIRNQQSTRTPSTQPARFSVKGLLATGIKRLLCPEPEILWVPFALAQARRIITRHKIQLILVTVPPFSALVVGYRLKREFPFLTLVSDFRDEWLSFYLKDFEFQNSQYTRRRAEAIERQAVERSDMVVAVNESSRREIRRRYPDQADDKFQVIPNGYDPDVFAGLERTAHRSARMVVTHVGTVYKTASPRYYFEALDELPEEIRGGIETRFIGRISDGERATIEQRGGNVRVLGFVPQSEAVKFMAQTDYLLLTMMNEISVPGKLYEYMAVGRPILAITPDGSEVDAVLRDTGAGISAPPDDRRRIVSLLMQAFSAWQNRVPLVEQSERSVRRYERARLVKQYAQMMSVASEAEP